MKVVIIYIATLILLQFHSILANFTLEDMMHMREYSEKYRNDPTTPMMLALMEELLAQNLKKWYGSDNGLHIKDRNTLEKRLSIGRKYLDCRRDHSLLYYCLITKNDAVDLQEWLIWQILFVGVHQVFVYVNDPLGDNTWDVIKPFIDLGYVTGFNATGLNRQNDIYEHCTSIIREKSCYFRGPTKGESILSGKNCSWGQDYDVYNGKDRVVWLAGFDSDEFPIDMRGNCLIDALPKYDNVNGLALPWFHFGPSGHFLTPNTLVTESYTTRLMFTGPLSKVINRVYFIKKITNSHSAVFKNGDESVDEYFQKHTWRDYNITLESKVAMYQDKPIQYPHFRLYHFLTKSMEHLIKKWIRGVADQHEGNRSKRRPLSDILEWVNDFHNPNRIVVDTTLLQFAKIMREVMFDPV